ncbi:uncharacterized protein PITG_07002 [Phytophthora infestans T30-4]|uniref:Uncharacterized protein n=1 Tax=Phytophthora infestans (strain T30-4) TaxID=403677 RepID=D0N704_PHYIT|nr:uncharacterized protein PITG_07002 [Phytophthora infestans T30-4]EEY53353.1 hypothetical protein PITG_07002 [Phytophthora infestans T30-4]|eukprot:XP_002904971.1 hypothetical protein PITG_07002 [Phytophthora infestans T30-4]
MTSDSELNADVVDTRTVRSPEGVKHKAYFFAITDAVRKVSDPQDTCTYSGSEATKETNTGDLVGSGVNFFVGFLILVFIRRVLNQRKNRYRFARAFRETVWRLTLLATR